MLVYPTGPYLAVTGNASAGGSLAYTAGYLTGVGIIVLLLLAGIGRCIAIMRRPQANRICGSALLAYLCGWLMGVVGFGAIGAFPEWGAVLAVCAASSLWISFLASLALAIAGLADYDKARHSHGRGQAIWTLVLNGVSIVGILGIAVASIIYGLRAQEQPVRSAAVIENRDYNFSLAPAGHWVSMKPERLNDKACLALRAHQAGDFFAGDRRTIGGAGGLGRVAGNFPGQSGKCVRGVGAAGGKTDRQRGDVFPCDQPHTGQRHPP
ncbi:MAG: hypothetical protein HC901_01520 [Bdellovibrionaceae bacterium]|nr:hypothetical protein [Pseudobdellovibrionaceae bacterium]